MPVAYVRGSQEYQNYHADTLAKWYIREGNSHNSDRAKAIFVKALKEIQQAASEAVQHSETYLQLFIADVGADTCNIISSVRYSDLGENAMLDTPKANWAGKMQEVLQNDDLHAATTTRDDHYTKIQSTLTDFLAKNELTPDYPDWWDYVRAVIISGDASELGLQRLRSSVNGALSQHKDKTRDSIDPLYVEAMGAAQRGRHQILTPGFLDDIVLTNYVVEHDEL
ncbi:MAG: hypothetical protein Q9209_005626 [Squamulea sp. 1 TL-2023]